MWVAPEDLADKVRWLRDATIIRSLRTGVLVLPADTRLAADPIEADLLQYSDKQLVDSEVHQG